MATTTQNKEVQDPAATAALKVTGGSSKGTYPLDADHKLSSASAAQSLKKAQPRDLPSFPSTGIANKQASAGAAASLAFAGQKSFEHWKPEQSKPAGKAALLAHDSKPPEFWQPEASAAGSKAALLAHRNTTGVNIWQPDPTSEGNSAAGIAMRRVGDEASRPKSSSPALSSARRKRAESIPVSYSYPDATNSASNALKAATKAHAPKPEVPVYNDLPGFSPEEAARIHKAATTNMDRSMYTAAPPVAPEVEEKNRQAGLRAAAISMAKNMMAAQEKAAEKAAIDEGQAAARASHGNKTSTEIDRREAALQYLTLQDAAKKLAAERLAKINDESEEYRQYYGAFSPNKSRMSLRARRRSSSDVQQEASDRARSEKIRSEMSLFTSKLAEVDSRKRQSDRDNLLAAAQKNVKDNMKGLDERVFLETGKASPAMKAQWEASAREKAEKDSKARMENYGKVHIGGGQYMDQSAIDAIAAAKVQPTLDEVSRKAEAQRALDEQRRQEAEEQKRVAEAKAAEEKERKRETKLIWQKFKAEEKERKKEEKEKAEIERIYQATAEEQDRKAKAAEEEAKKAALEKEEKERAAKTESSWKQLKEAEKKEKEEKTRKNQEKRKSRIGSMFASIGLGGDKEKKEEAKDSKGKSPEVVKAEPKEIEEPEKTEDTKEVVPEAPEAISTAASAEALKKVAEGDEAGSAEELVLPESTEERLALAEAIYVPTDIKEKDPEAAKPIPVPVAAPVATSAVAAKPTVSATPTAPTSSKTKAEKDESRQSWFKRKFSRSSKEDRPPPGTIGKLKRGQDESPKAPESKAKTLKISNPIPIGSTAIATTSTVPESLPSTAGTASMERATTQDEASDPDGAKAIAAASALPSHISAVHRSDTDTNLSERDVALAGKEEQDPVTSASTTEERPLILSSIPEPPTSKAAERSRSTSISSLSSAASHTPSNSMRGVASAALAAGERLDAEEALRRAEETKTLEPIDTSRTSESQDNFEEARDGLDELSPSGTNQKELRSPSASSASGRRETKFHEEL